MPKNTSFPFCLVATLLLIISCFSLRSTSALQSAVVVGAGPAGLATALILAKKHGYQNVTVLESSMSRKEHLAFDPSRAYLYNINGRGQKLTQRFPDLQKAMQNQGVGITKFARFTVPADPHEIFDTQPFSRGMRQEVLDNMGVLYWIPRYLFLQLLLQEVEKESTIQVCFGHECRGVSPYNSNGMELLQVDAENVAKGDSVAFRAQLVIGAEGPRSMIRHVLQTQPKHFSGWRNYHPRRFRIKKWKSPSVGLRLKTLQLEPSLKIPVGNGTLAATKSVFTYAFQSINKGGKSALSLTLLPIRDPTVKRPVAVATPEDHDLWKIATGKDMKAWMTRAFPRFPFHANDEDENHLVKEEEWERFARSEGSRFPHCQYCRGLSTWSTTGLSGIALIGDAIHAFPPDMGQGVNMALGDVVVLDDCLASHADESLGAALSAYQKEREGETRSVVRMSRFAAPFQYGQSSLLMRTRKSLWFMNLALRMALNKLTRGFLPNPGIIAMMDPGMSFQTIMRRSDALTIALSSIFVAFLTRVLVVVRKGCL